MQHTHTHTLAFKRMRLLKLESYLNVRAVFAEENLSSIYTKANKI